MSARFNLTLCLALACVSAASGQRLHPQVRLLDAQGQPVVQTGAPIDTLKTCDGCHDAAYIQAHHFHSQAGQGEPTHPGARPWDLSPGLFGRWDPLTYRRLSPKDDPRVDLTPEAWTRQGTRHVGGGPAVGAQLDCFLCHVNDPDHEARLRALSAGQGAWAATATLSGARPAFIIPSDDPARPWRYDPAAFEPDGHLKRGALNLQTPSDKNCGLCHGAVAGLQDEITLSTGIEHWETETTGQIFSAQRIKRSQINIEEKTQLGRPWDVHSERMLSCTSCHHAANHPSAFAERSETRPDHLKHDARILTMSQYLHRPNHNFTKGDSAQGTIEESLDHSMRRCEGCHDANAVHDWLPYKSRHMQALLCETCHIPKLYAPARQQTDWTLIDTQAQPLVAYRGLEGDGEDRAALVTGFHPVILPRDGEATAPKKLAPHNLITSWFWIERSGATHTPARLVDLKAAFLIGDRHHPDLIKALDTDGDGALKGAELRLDTADKVAAARARLIAVGVSDPQISGEIQPYSLHHGVAAGRFVLKSCEACHDESSHLTRPFELSSYVPFGATARLVGDTNVSLNGEIVGEAGRLVFKPDTREAGHYILGHNSTPYADLLGLLSLLGVLLGVTGHGGLRFLAARRQRSK
ncbi:hypothetical protein KKF91_18985 [Myxococcota bacterium]|nr:hypothetical protein [Myxococcota bacterium]MBU1432630.1 hypothetical protein [Myxococcota bacterium]MBU1899507.1 hypothetical protein [Myxococcota bacterium]